MIFEGDQIEVAPGDFRTVNFLRFIGVFRNGGNGDGLPSGLSDTGDLAFFARFSDGSEGIFTAIVPEPSAGVLSLMGVVYLVFFGSRLQRRA